MRSYAFTVTFRRCTRSGTMSHPRSRAIPREDGGVSRCTHTYGMSCIRKGGTRAPIFPAACASVLSRGHHQKLMAMREAKRARIDPPSAAPTSIVAASSQERGNHYVARGRTTIVPGRAHMGMQDALAHARMSEQHLHFCCGDVRTPYVFPQV